MRMRPKYEIKWNYFVDKRNDKTTKALINGKELMHALTDVFFELTILDDGSLIIKVEDEQRPFFSENKLTKLYGKMYDKIYEYCKSEDHAFYNEDTHTYCKIKNRVYSSIENTNW